MSGSSDTRALLWERTTRLKRELWAQWPGDGVFSDELMRKKAELDKALEQWENLEGDSCSSGGSESDGDGDARSESDGESESESDMDGDLRYDAVATS